MCRNQHPKVKINKAIAVSTALRHPIFLPIGYTNTTEISSNTKTCHGR